MRTFSAGSGPVRALAYGPDGRHLLVDVREPPARHPWMGFAYQPARELVWWDWLNGTAHRRFRLRDSLYGPHGALAGMGRPDWRPDSAAFDLSFSVNPWLIATAWDWTNKEDGVCVYDADKMHTVDLRTPYKTHILRLALAPDGQQLAAATINDMDGSALFEVWNLAPRLVEPPPASGTDRPWVQQRIQEAQRGYPIPFHLTALAFDGRFVAAAGAEQTRVVVWDSRQPPEEEEEVEGEGAWPDDDRWAAEALRRAPGGDAGFVPLCLAFAAGTPRLAVGGAGLVVYDQPRNHWMHFSRTGSAVTALTLSADGGVLLAGTEAGTVEVWDVAGKRLLTALDWASGPLTAVALAPEGQTAAAGTSAGQVIVWDRDDRG